jgi:hypothetical protein
MTQGIVELQMLQDSIHFQNEQLRQFLVRLITDVLFRGDTSIAVFEDLKGVSTFKSGSIMRNYPCAPQICIGALGVFFPQVIHIKKKYPPKWLRWLVRPHYQITLQIQAENTLKALHLPQLLAVPKTVVLPSGESQN